MWWCLGQEEERGLSVSGLKRTHVVDVLGWCGGGGGGGDDGGRAAVCHVFVMSRWFHLHIAALWVFTQSRRVVNGGVRVLTVEGAGAGQGALHVV